MDNDPVQILSQKRKNFSFSLTVILPTEVHGRRFHPFEFEIEPSSPTGGQET
ncbi:hypothetical protein HAX54_032422, partial [Datura stramonium]|nr:hypothetical protein [Datura stramonium]